MPEAKKNDDLLLRYSRLERYAPFQNTLERWQSAKIAIVGVGGLGGGLALHLARMGASSQGGHLRLIDRDNVEPQNMGHQQLFTEEHAEFRMPKVEAAAETLLDINSTIALELRYEELNRESISRLLGDCTMIFDGLDNYYGRLLLNDFARKHNLPYFHAGVVRGELSAKAVLPGRGSCLRCFLEAPPLPGETATCASEGVFPPLLQLANALQIDFANRWLAGSTEEDDTDWFSLDAATWRMRRTSAPLNPDCPACQGRYEFLDDSKFDGLRTACSEGRYEIETGGQLNVETVERRLEQSGGFQLRRNRYMLSARRGDHTFSIFDSGRVILSGGTSEQELSRFMAEYLGG